MVKMHSAGLLVLAALPLAYGQLNTLAKARGMKYFGTATDNPELSDKPYVAKLSNTADFGQITPGNTQKWVFVQPSPTTFTYAQGDVVVDLAEKNDQLVRCHNLVWYNELPSWVSSSTSWTNATLIAALKNHVTKEVTHYKGQCYCWDVVNEAFNDDGTWRQDVFYNTIGPEYIAIAFEAAAAADPKVKLYYNDYNIETLGAKSTSAQNLVKSLKARGIKIDGVGLQAHFIVGETPSTAAQVSNMQAFINLGVEVAITELDVRFQTLPASTSGLAQQSTDYVSTVKACLNVGAKCVGVTVWDFDDKYSWIPSTFPGQGAGCLFDANLKPKPAYYGIVNLLKQGLPAATQASSMSASMATMTTVTTSAASMYYPAPTSASASATAPASVPKYAQCGGEGYTGSTTCEQDSTCMVSNPWYSQCM